MPLKSAQVYFPKLELYGENNVHLKQKMMISELLVFVKDGRGHTDGDRWRQHYKRAGLVVFVKHGKMDNFLFSLGSGSDEAERRLGS